MVLVRFGFWFGGLVVIQGFYIQRTNVKPNCSEKKGGRGWKPTATDVVGVRQGGGYGIDKIAGRKHYQQHPMPTPNCLLSVGGNGHENPIIRKIT